MRKISLLVGLGIFSLACSVDREELPDEELFAVDLITNIDGCTVYRYELGDAALVEIRNSNDELIIKVSADETSSLNQINYHFTEDASGFPTTKKGKFITGKMNYKNKYPQGTYYEEFVIPLSEVPDEFAMVIYAEFGSGKNKYNAWAGDLSVEGADWSYFDYVVEPFPYYTGTDQVREITLSEATAIGSWNEVRKLYANMMDDGVDNSQWYAYDPSIDDIIADFNDPNREPNWETIPPPTL